MSDYASERAKMKQKETGFPWHFINFNIDDKKHECCSKSPFEFRANFVQITNYYIEMGCDEIGAFRNLQLGVRFLFFSHL